MGKTSAIFKFEWIRSFEELTYEERWNLWIDACFYTAFGLKPTKEHKGELFENVCVSLRNDNEKYEKMCERNKGIATTRGTSGKTTGGTTRRTKRVTTRSTSRATDIDVVVDKKNFNNQNFSNTDVVVEKDGEQQQHTKTENFEKKKNVPDETNAPPCEPTKEKTADDDFVPPKVSEVRAYCKERKNNVDAQDFVDYYNSRNWYSGRIKITDWKLFVRKWERLNSKHYAKSELAERLGTNFSEKDYTESF